MPHDMNGQQLAVGDEVNVPCIVKEIQPGDEYCNVTLETEHPMPPGGQKQQLSLNTKQVVKIALMFVIGLLFAGDVEAGCNGGLFQRVRANRSARLAARAAAGCHGAAAGCSGAVVGYIVAPAGCNSAAPAGCHGAARPSINLILPRQHPQQREPQREPRYEPSLDLEAGRQPDIVIERR